MIRVFRVFFVSLQRDALTLSLSYNELSADDSGQGNPYSVDLEK